MTKINKYIEKLLTDDKRKKQAVIITTDDTFVPKFKHEKLMDGIFSARISFRQMQEMLGEDAIKAVEPDSKMDALHDIK